MYLRLALAGLLASGTGARTEERSASADLLSAADRASVRSGALLAKVVDTEDRTEVMSVAAVRAAVDLDRLLAYARTPLGVHRAEDSLGEGRVGSPPTAADFSALRLDNRDLELLSSCQVGDCSVRLTADAIAQMRRVDWSARGRGPEADRAFRAMLANEATAYLARGHVGLTAYGDGPGGTHRAEGLTELLRRPLFLLEGADELADYLRSFPAGRPRLVDEFLSWRQEKFWRRPVIGLYHTMIWEASRPGERRIIVATKQIYASHFYESSVDLLEVRKSDRETEADLVFVSRVRADIRPSGFNWLERLLVRRLVRGRLEDQFESLRAKLREPAVVRKAPLPGAPVSGVRPRASDPSASFRKVGTLTRAGEGSLEGTPGGR